MTRIYRGTIGANDGFIQMALETGRFEVAGSGRITNRWSRFGGAREVKQTVDVAGYVRCVIGGKEVNVPGRYSRTVMVHRVVLIAFVGLPPVAGMDCNHKNGNRGDNRIENLEWLDRAGNVRHSCRVLGRKQWHPIGELSATAKLSEEDVRMIHCLTVGGFKIARIARRFDISEATVRLIQKGKNWAHLALVSNGRAN